MAEQLETVENIRKQYIVVKIGNEQYGIDISYVDNIVLLLSFQDIEYSEAFASLYL